MKAWRWVIPIAAIPVLVLLAYGFKTNPRDIPSPLVGKSAAPFALTSFDGAPVSLSALKGQRRRRQLLGVVVLSGVL